MKIVDGKDYISEVKDLIIGYSQRLGRDLSFQNIDDTIVPLKTAISLYKKHGFEECEAYYHNPMDDVIYMRKTL